MSIKVMLVDDHQILREGIKCLFRSEPGFEVVAEAPDGSMAVQLAREVLPDVVVIDTTMPNISGIEATGRIVAENPGIKVVALSMRSDERSIVEMIRAGASGYLLKDCNFEELLRAIKVVVSEQFYLSPGVAGVIIKDYVKNLHNSTPSRISSLTPREREVLQLLAEGKTTGQIAAILHLSIKTVETHRRKIMDKLGLYSIAELTKFAIREGLTSL